MQPAHKNPTRMRRHILDKDSGEFIDVQAHAPYNFVPLPAKMVETQMPLPSVGIFEEDTLTGWLEFDIETCSPTYIRGMMTKQEYDEFGQKAVAELDDVEKIKRAPFFSLEKGASNSKFPKPAIPGSSLRGMLRSIIEIAGYGRMRWVAANPTFTYRAVAAEAQDALKEPYKEFMGSNAANVRAGYFERDSKKDLWYIRPAMHPKDCGIKAGRSERYFLKVDDEDISPHDVQGFIKMADPNYHPQVHGVWFKAGPQVNKRPEILKKARRPVSPTRPSWVVKEKMANGFKRGTLVCSGNMRETIGDGSQDSPRARHYILMPPDMRANRIPVPEQVIDDYRAGLTDYQKEKLGAWAGGDQGCVGNGKPVFFVSDNPDAPTKIRFFGHSPNFRIPAFLSDECASTPLDFVPETIRKSPTPDIADGIFGWVEEVEWGPKEQRAGRVFFEDAIFADASGELWLKDEPITPKILASPKSTTIQHYLVQDTEKKHNPDERIALANYGTPSTETAIRGHKFYWHKGAHPEIIANPDDVQKNKKQYTLIIPLNTGVRFHARVRFENMRSYELGALIWALNLPGKAQKGYRHKIGMGKPLGMGSIAITNLKIQGSHLQSENSRYTKLFASSKDNWHVPVNDISPNDHQKEFEKFVIRGVGLTDKPDLADDERIQALLTMLEWQGENPGKEWMDMTRYMEIEHQDPRRGISYNEYKSRPVLPTPFGIWAKLTPSQAEDLEPKRGDQRPRSQGTQKHAPTIRKSGTVKWYRQGDYGYHGYITPDGGGEDVHFDEKHLKDKTRVPKPGQKVRFGVWLNKNNKPNAVEVEII